MWHNKKSHKLRRLAEWMDTEDVCRMLSITPKTLQAMRDRHGIAYSQIGRKFYYRPEDVERLLPVPETGQPSV